MAASVDIKLDTRSSTTLLARLLKEGNAESLVAFISCTASLPQILHEVFVHASKHTLIHCILRTVSDAIHTPARDDILTALAHPRVFASLLQVCSTSHTHLQHLYSINVDTALLVSDCVSLAWKLLSRILTQSLVDVLYTGQVITRIAGYVSYTHGINLITESTKLLCDLVTPDKNMISLLPQDYISSLASLLHHSSQFSTAIGQARTATSVAVLSLIKQALIHQHSLGLLMWQSVDIKHIVSEIPVYFETRPQLLSLVLEIYDLTQTPLTAASLILDTHVSVPEVTPLPHLIEHDTRVCIV